MGTRGLLGVVVDGVVKATYNHFDSYPDALGLAVLEYVQQTNLERDTQKARDLKLVKEATPPTKEEIKKLEKYADPFVSSGNKKEWYVLLRETQGRLREILDCGYMVDSIAFAKDSLFCEYGYVVNFDKQVVECYRGFVKEPHKDGRFASKTPNKDGYYPIRLVGELTFDIIKNTPIEPELVDMLNKLYDEE